MLRLERLRHSIAILSSPADRQIEYLAELGLFGDDENIHKAIHSDSNVDEIVLEFEDIFMAILDMRDRNEINDRTVAAVTNFWDKLDLRTRNRQEDFWTVGSLRANPTWGEIRSMAKECLAVMDSN